MVKTELVALTDLHIKCWVLSWQDVAGVSASLCKCIPIHHDSFSGCSVWVGASLEKINQSCWNFAWHEVDKMAKSVDNLTIFPFITFMANGFFTSNH